MNKVSNLLVLISLALLSACDSHEHGHEGHDEHAAHEGHDGHGAEPEPIQGPNGGRLLEDGDFTLELVLFEAGVPPEYRVGVTDGGQPIAPEDVNLNIVLTRLGNVQDNINFVIRTPTRPISSIIQLSLFKLIVLTI